MTPPLSKPEPFHVTITASDTRYGFAVNAQRKQTTAYRIARACDRGSTDNLLYAAVHACKVFNPRRVGYQLGLLQAWRAQQHPTYASSATRRPVLLPLTLRTSNADMLAAATYLRGHALPAGFNEATADIATRLQHQLKRFDCHWLLITPDDPDLTALETFTAKASFEKSSNEASRQDFYQPTDCVTGYIFADAGHSAGGHDAHS